MKVIAALAFAGIVTPFAPAACAQDMYVGLSVTTPGETYTDFPTARHVRNNNNPLGVKLEAGVELAPGFALEAGYGAFGTWKTADPTPGSGRQVRGSAALLYVAGKGDVAITDALSLFGKLGIAANRFRFSDEHQAVHTSFVRPMIGFGADYAITKHFGVSLEYDYFGAAGGYRQQKLGLGAKLRF
jgi:OOP family OmpA-OmpF porin